MKRIPKLLITVLVLVLFVGIFSTTSFAASDEYAALPLKTAQLTVGYYADLSMSGEIVNHSANDNYTKEVSCLIDNKNSNAYWSKAIKFSALKDNGGTTVPVILIDVANGGEGVTISGFDMQLRKYFDCMPIHFELQATTSANSTEWISIIDKDNLVWNDLKLRFTFDEVTVYKVRALFYNIGDADISNDTGTYETLLGDETRFALSEIDLLQKKEGGSTGNGDSTTTPTTGGQSATRPGIQFPTQSTTQAPTQSATKAPTQPATQAPTQAATQAPTQSATKTPTQPATQASTQTTTQTPTQAATQVTTTTTEPAGTVAPTEPTATVDSSAPTDPTEIVDPSAPTEEPTVAPTEEPTVAPSEEPTVDATEPEATIPTTDNGGEQKPDNTWIIVVAIVAAAAIAGGAIFFIIKKKKNG